MENITELLLYGQPKIIHMFQKNSWHLIQRNPNRQVEFKFQMDAQTGKLGMFTIMLMFVKQRQQVQEQQDVFTPA
jgi:hypothetical protein